MGLGCKLYGGPGSGWVNDSLSGVFYEVFWCLFGGMILRHARPRTIAVAVFTVTCLVEVSQLWHAQFLQAIRATFIGVTLLGDTFAPSDFAYYAVGCAVGWWLLRRLRGTPVERGRPASM